MIRPKIAILGISLESNAFATPCGLSAFEDYAYLLGEEILHSTILKYWLGGKGEGGFIGKMTELTDWQPVPILLADAQANGPLQHEVYLELLGTILEKLKHESRIDGVYIVAHGAGTTTKIDDLDGDYFHQVRQLVGPDIPIVATLDLHANVSKQMSDSVDLLIGQRTNPHVDTLQRAEDAACALHMLLCGKKFKTAMINLPLITPQVSQLSSGTGIFSQIIKKAELALEQQSSIRSLSIFPGFAFSDTPENGFVIYGFAEQQAQLNETIQTLAEFVWQNREKFNPQLSSLEFAMRRAQEKQRDTPLILADIADNPGGGATGNTAYLLHALISNKIKNAVVAPFVDPNLAQQASRIEAGQCFNAIFNSVCNSQFTESFTFEAKLLWKGNGDYLSTFGIYAGSLVPLGQSCVLQINDVKVIVISAKQQLLGADMLEHFGLDPKSLNVIVAKSRGHFRAGFSHVIPSHNILEVDLPGLTTPDLLSVNFRRLKRACFPLNSDIQSQFNILV